MQTQYLKPLPGGAFALLLMLHSLAAHAVSLEFFGLSPSHEGQYVGRVRIPIDDPDIPDDPGPAVDVGATDFTIEFWMRTTVPGPSISCSSNNWIRGNILIDRDRYNQDRSYGIAITDGVVAFGVTAGSSETVCGSTNVADDDWHHVAVQRSFSDGRLFIYVDGELDADEGGPNGDISYPDNGYPESNCVINGTSNRPCLESDPYIVIGAEKHDADVEEYPPYIGKIDELRFSNILRYNSSGYDVEALRNAPFPDGNADPTVVAMYHFEEGGAGTNCVTDTPIYDSAKATTSYCRFGGNSSGGPRWSTDTPFSPLPPGSGSSSSSSSSSTSSSSGGTGSSSSSSSGGGDGGGGGAFHIGSIVLLLAAIFRRRSRVTDITSRHPESFTMKESRI